MVRWFVGYKLFSGMHFANLKDDKFRPPKLSEIIIHLFNIYCVNIDISVSHTKKGLSTVVVPNKVFSKFSVFVYQGDSRGRGA